MVFTVLLISIIKSKSLSMCTLLWNSEVATWFIWRLMIFYAFSMKKNNWETGIWLPKLWTISLEVLSVFLNNAKKGIWKSSKTKMSMLNGLLMKFSVSKNHILREAQSGFLFLDSSQASKNTSWDRSQNSIKNKFNGSLRKCIRKINKISKRIQIKHRKPIDTEWFRKLSKSVFDKN